MPETDIGAMTDEEFRRWSEAQVQPKDEKEANRYVEGRISEIYTEREKDMKGHKGSYVVIDIESGNCIFGEYCGDALNEYRDAGLNEKTAFVFYIDEGDKLACLIGVDHKESPFKNFERRNRCCSSCIE